MIKEPRRAKRNKIWLAEGNIIPLSTAELKSVQNKIYRLRIKREQQTIKYTINYSEELFNFLNKQYFTHTGTLTYNYNISIDKAYSNAMYLFETLLLRGYLTNYYFINEYEDNHNHTHYMLNVSEGINDIQGVIYRMLNCSYDTCKNWIKQLTCDAYRINTINYFVKKLEPDFYNYKYQFQKDYWFYNKNINNKKELLSIY